jgi:3-hydroxyacyl-[acyl-carrier-protein] dehydratase
MSDISIRDILGILPHRFPMLLVDRVTECDDATRIVALKNVTINEPFFAGHYPGDPIMPGVLQIEAMAQAGSILVLRMNKGADRKIPVFMGIDKARFRKMAVPGDQLRIEMQVIQLRGAVARFSGKIFIGDALASEAELTCMLREQERPA